MLKRHFSENSLIGVTFLLVVGLAYPAFHSLMDDSERDHVVKAPQAFTQERTPASIADSAAQPAILSTADFDFSCVVKESKAWEIAESFIQFQGKSCLGKSAEGAEVEIVNRRNGYTASVFFVGIENYKTDLIQLEHGENEIAFRYKERNGKSIERVLKVRTSKI